MEEDEKGQFFMDMVTQQGVKNGCKRELRGLELSAFSSVMDAFRAGGTLNKDKRKVMDSLKHHFNISESRHIAECRRVSVDTNLSRIASCLRDPNDSDEWISEGYGIFPALPQFPRGPSSLAIKESLAKLKEDPDPPPIPTFNPDLDLDRVTIEDASDTELFKQVSLRWHSKVKKVNKKVQTKKVNIRYKSNSSSTTRRQLKLNTITIKSEDESSDDEPYVKEHEQSPDIVDIHTPMKVKVKVAPNSSKGLQSINRNKHRGVKRKLPTSGSTTATVVLNKGQGNEVNSTQFQNQNHTGNAMDIDTTKLVRKLNFKGPGRPPSTNKATRGKYPKIKFVKRRLPDSSDPDRSSDDDTETKPDPKDPTLDLPQRRPNTKITSSSRGRGGQIHQNPTRIRGRGISRGRGSTRGRPQNKATVPYLHPYPPPLPPKMDVSPTRSESHTTVSVSSSSSLSPVKRPGTKTLKVLKPKKPKQVSVSRRKSRLKEKEDDDMQVEWNDYGYEDDCMIMSNRDSNSRMPIKKRKHFNPEDEYNQENSNDTVNSTSSKLSKNNNEMENGDMDHLHHHHQLKDEDNLKHPTVSELSIRIGIDTNKSPTLSGEETDSASEKGSVTSKANDSPSNSIVSANSNQKLASSPSPPPSSQRQKQRLKSPLNPNPQLPRITLPPPIFSTTLSAAQKKRPQKQMSVVDSLNLHLPTTPTASSLAASNQRSKAGMGAGGAGIFSNQAQQLLAQSRGGCSSPGIGILQQQQIQIQRKAHPHILSNSKLIANQRNFPVSSANSSINSISNISSISPIGTMGMCVSMSGSTMQGNNSINSIVSSSGTILSSGCGPVHQVQNVIPTITPNSGVMQIPSSASNLGIQGGIQMGAVPGQGPNIIFLQKANSNPIVSTSTIGISSNTMPVKTSSRAVILRRTQIPRQGNVMILDVQKNQMVNAGHVPQFLQSTRILTAAAPPELSVLNLQGTHVPRKIIQAHPIEPTEPSVVYSLPTPAQGQQRKTKLIGVPQQIIVPNPNVSVANNVTEVRPTGQDPAQQSTNPQGQGDPQFAQIEAELLQMEQGMVYEEEVVTSQESISSNNNNNEQFSGTSTGSSEDNEEISHRNQKSMEVSLTPGIEARQMSDILTRAIIESHSGSVSSSSEQNSDHSSGLGSLRSSGESIPSQQEDIFAAALKSSGIVFTEQNFFGVEEICTNIDESRQLPSVDVSNHVTIANQENGSNTQ